MGEVRFESLRWQPVPMPYSSGPVSLARLPLEGSTFLAFVRFPVGWSRPVPVVYEAAEEFVILEGDLRINEHHWTACSYGCVPAGTARTLTESQAGCLAWARFHGSPKPRRIEDVPAVTPLDMIQVDLGDITTAAGERPLQSLAASQTWFTPFFDTQHLRSSGGSRYDALLLDDLAWWTVDAATDLQPIGHDPLTRRPAIVHRTSETSR